MPKKRVKTSALWAFALMLMISTIAVAQVGDAAQKPIVNQWGITAPFLTSWIPVWIFCVIGGIGSIFIKIGDIDDRFRWLYVAKPYLGIFSGIMLCVAVTDGRDPPEVILSSYGGVASFLGSAIMQFLAALLSSPKNSLAVVNKVSPVQFELPDGQGGSNDKH